MINVGIAGSLAAINRHKYALSQLHDIRVAGTWSAGGSEHFTDHSTSLLLPDSEKILDKIDVLIITDPGKAYNQLATLALRKARHVFLYPVVLNVMNEVYQLIKLAREANVILKCGITGKESIRGLLSYITDPAAIGIIEYQHVLKIDRFTGASSLPETVLGDMEKIVRLIKARNISVKAKGLSMISGKAEVVNARMDFDNGSAVNYYCNTVGTRNEHHITILLKERIIEYNLLRNELSGWYLNRISDQGVKPDFMEPIRFEHTDDLVDELYTFFNLIQSGSAFLSIYDNGFESCVLSDRILEKVMKTLIQYA